MAKASRDKGRRGELEVLARLNDIGGDAVLLYGQAELGGQDGDVSCTYGLHEVKRRAAFPKWMDLRENVRGVYARRDRGPWLVLIRATDYETLLKENRTLRSHDRDIYTRTLLESVGGPEGVKRALESIKRPTPIQDNIDNNCGVYSGPQKIRVPKWKKAD